jgi:hypothetical protein
MKRDKKWNTDERARREAERRKDKHKMRVQKEKNREEDIENGEN